MKDITVKSYRSKNYYGYKVILDNKVINLCNPRHKLEYDALQAGREWIYNNKEYIETITNKSAVDAINKALDALESLHTVCTQDNKDVLIQALESASVARYLAARVNNQDEMGEFSGYEAQVQRFISEPYTPILHTVIKKFLDIPVNGPEETPESIG